VKSLTDDENNNADEDDDDLLVLLSWSILCKKVIASFGGNP
jgi:hypothetical protein